MEEENIEEIEENIIQLNNQQSNIDERSEAITHKESALKRLGVSFNKHIELQEYKKNNILAHWVKDFANYHDNEKNFDFKKIKIYRRGDIIKANLGFNIGNELGGLHYCLVLNKDDNHSFGTLTVAPLTSIKEDKKYPKYSINIGDELYQLLYKKYNTLYDKLMPEIEQALEELKLNNTTASADKIQQLASKLDYLKKINKEIGRMKYGSIVLINQITTISKQRIYDPINNNGILSKIRLSSSSLDNIDEELKKMLTK